MVKVRERVAGFIQEEGHRVEVSVVDEVQDLAEIVFRTRGQMFSVAVSEADPNRVSLSTAYRLASSGQIPGLFRVGIQYRVSVPKFLREVHGDTA